MEIALSDNTSNYDWFVARIRPGESVRALRSLSQNNISHVYPLIEVFGEQEPLIPGYVFVGLFGSADEFATVNDSAGIDQLLPIGAEQPSQVPQAWMQDFFARLSSGEYDLKVEPLEKPLPWFNKNEILTVTSGAFCGHNGVFKRVEKGVVVLDVKFFERTLEVKLKGHQIHRFS